jgi:hypothetical protein
VLSVNTFDSSSSQDLDSGPLQNKGSLQWQSKNWPLVYRYTRMEGFKPITSPPL